MNDDLPLTDAHALLLDHLQSLSASGGQQEFPCGATLLSHRSHQDRCAFQYEFDVLHEEFITQFYVLWLDTQVLSKTKSINQFKSLVLANS